MFDILLQKKKVILMNEISSNPYLPERFENALKFHLKDPIEREIKNLKTRGSDTFQQTNLNVQRVILKGFANMPELFNKIDICSKRGESCSNL